MNERQPRTPLAAVMDAVDEHIAKVNHEAEPLKASTYDPRLALIISFRHGRKSGEATMIEFLMNDKIIADVLMDYFSDWGLPAKLLQPTAHSDVRRVLREVP